MTISVLLGLDILFLLVFAPLMKPSFKMFYFNVMVFKACGSYFKETRESNTTALRKPTDSRQPVGNFPSVMELNSDEQVDLNLEYLSTFKCNAPFCHGATSR